MTMKTRIVSTLALLLLSVVGFSQNITNRGKEFWVAYGHHQYMERSCGSPTDNAPNDMNMVIYLSAEQAATVTITIDSSGSFPTIPGSWWKRTYNVPANTVVSISDALTPAASFSPASVLAYGPIPKGPINAAASGTDGNFDARLINPPVAAGGNGGDGLFRGKGIHIVSNVPIVAYAHIYGGVSSGATMLMPVEAWGYSYTSMNSEQRDADRSYSFMYVVAKEDKTRITITPSALTRTGRPANVPFTVDLQKGQIWQVIGDAVCATGNGPELTGTTVKSIPGADGKCHPIAVFSGSSRTGGETLTCGTGSGRDNDMQQLFPESAWGKRYATAPFSKATGAALQPSNFMTSVYKVLVKDPNTVVTRNGVQLTGLINGKYYKFSSNTADYIMADKPIMVGQFMSGTGACNGGLGDPEMVYISPIEQAIKRVGFYRNTKEAIQANYVTLVLPTAGVTSLRIDGSGTFNHTYPHPNLPGYTVVVKGWLPSSQAQCLVTCDSVFNATTYGLGGAESYAYNAGTYINNLGALPFLHNQLDPTQPEHPYTCVGSPVEISALIAYKPINIVWHLDSLAAVISPNAVVNMSNPATLDSVLVDGIWYYKYTLPGTYQFSDTGTFYLPISCTSPTIDNCNNTEMLRIPIVVKLSPKPAFNWTHTGCTLDTVYLTGSNMAGTYTLAAWNWSISSGGTATGKDTVAMLAPGTHDITLTAISDEGCVGDTTRTITIHPKPIATFGITPPTVCFGQTITLTDTSSYAGTTPPITTWWWDLGNGNTLNNPNNNSVVVNYAAPNTYTIKHIVKVSPNCVSDTAVKTVLISPEAQIAFTYPTTCLPTSGVAQFGAAPTDLGGIPIASYSWNFGDPASGANNTSTAQNPTHTYSTFGTYPVTLSVVTNSGCGGDTTINLTFGVKPALNYPALSAVCINTTAPVSVGTATVTNGVAGSGSYAGPGITNATTGAFSPSVAGAGTHTITYSYVTPACTETITQTITVNAAPTVTSGTYAGVCVNAPAVTLNGTPVGGTFSGPGVAGTTFNPATAGAGTHTITYNYTDANGCTNANSSTITVNALPVVNAGTYTAVCINATPVALNGTPAGGTFSGPGVTGSTFNPATAGAGTHTITYTYTNASGCTNTNTASITVNALPVVNAGTYAAACLNAASVTLNGTPAGGTFSGPGVTGSSFNPATAGAGTHTITYNYTNASGCANSATTTITVNALPVVNAGTYAAVCINAAPVTLAGTPVGGTFSGMGVTGTSFNPATAGIGTHTITYNYTAANGCANSATTSVTVYSLPTVNAGTYAAICIDRPAITLAGTPAGGTFSGPGVTGTSFNPGTAGAGTHTITYLYTDAGGCTNSATTTITVTALPVLNAGTYAPVCINGSGVTLAGTPAGGTFSGTGVTGNTFNPATAGAGTHTLTYGGVGGCGNIITTTITVNPLPTVNAGTYAGVCINAAAVTLAGTPAGGTFSGPGVTGNSFNPATAGAGTHTITYNYTDGNGCANSATTTVTVNPLPTVSAGSYGGVCVNAPAVTLAGAPAGGTFSGTGVTGTTFNPATTGVGTHTINYTYTNANGCTHSVITTITVNALPVVNAGTYATVCLNGSAVALAGTPAGGTFSGTGVTGNSFNPATAGVGTHTLTYNYTDANACANSATTTITVNSLPVVNAGTYATVCVNASAVTLAGTPVGGTFSGPGVTGNSFNPATAGAGVHTITYTYTAASGCSNSATTSITVDALPTVNAGTYAQLCEDASAISLAGTPAGGTFSGPGVTGTSFNPVTAGVGTHTITYTYTNGNGCTNSGTTSITVNAVPSPAAGSYAPICFEGAAINLNGAPAGGTFSGPGVTGTTFNPSTAGAGIHTIVYSYTSTAGCSQTNTTTIEVHPRPTASFTANNSICLDGTSTLTSTSSVTSGNIANWNWNLGDGNTPSYTNGNPFAVSYANANPYTVQLVTISDKGCVSLPATQTIDVHPLPVVSFELPGSICMPGGNAQFVNKTSISDNSTLSYTWTFGDGNGSTITSPSNAYAATGSYTVTLVATSPFGCIDSDTKTLSNFFDKPIADFTVNPQELCQGADNNFRDGSSAPGSTIQSWNWVFNDGSTSTAANPVKKFNTPGTYNVQLTVKNTAGCVSDPYTLPVTVHLQPKIEAGPSFVVPQGTPIQFGATANSAGLNFSWSPPLGLSDPNALKPTLVANTDQTYILTATGSYGCTATDYLTVKILKPVVVPNIFTPNGDNIHDRWVIQHIEDYPGATVELFNRYGQQVYFAKGSATAWDGKYKGKDMPVGTYYYVIKLNNGFKMLNGSVTIVR